MICPSGDAASEANLINESALHSDVAEGAHASHANCVSSMTDNAARATSSAMKVLKGEELNEAKRLVEEHVAVPANMQHAVDQWLKLTPEQQAHAYEVHGIGCTGHSVNLTTDDSHKKSESTVLPMNMVRYRAALVLQRCALRHYVNQVKRQSEEGYVLKEGEKKASGVTGQRGLMFKGYVGGSPGFDSGYAGPVSPKNGQTKTHAMTILPAGKHLDGESDIVSVSDILWKVSKLFASEGEHHCYYLNEHRAFDLHARLNGSKPCRLVSNKVSLSKTLSYTTPGF